MSDAVEPAAQRPLPSQGAGAADQDQEGRLERILGLVRIVQEVTAQVQHHGTVPLDQGGKAASSRWLTKRSSRLAVLVFTGLLASNRRFTCRMALSRGLLSMTGTRPCIVLAGYTARRRGDGYAISQSHRGKVSRRRHRREPAVGSSFSKRVATRPPWAQAANNKGERRGVSPKWPTSRLTCPRRADAATLARFVSCGSAALGLTPENDWQAVATAQPRNFPQLKKARFTGRSKSCWGNS